MKLLSALLILCVSSSAFADVWNCTVKDPTKPASWPDERVTAEFDEFDLQTINYIHQIPNGDGTFKEQLELIYSVPQRIRGGFAVAYCASNDGHVSLQYGMVNMLSKCATADKQLPLTFRADLRTKQDGSLWALIQDLQGDNISRSISISPCQ
jgi:hypothetical protein